MVLGLLYSDVSNHCHYQRYHTDDMIVTSLNNSVLGAHSYCESNTPLSLLTNANNHDQKAVPMIHGVDKAASTQAVEA